MSEEQENSSLPILLGISVAVLVTVGAGWYLLDYDSASEPVTSQPPPDIPAPSEAVAQSETDAPAPAEEQPAEETGDVATEAIEMAAPESSVDADLRKARLAAEADILAFPEDQSALYYYNRILEADAGHEVARAELDAVLSKLGQTVTAHLAAQEYAEAHELAVLVSRRSPGHPLVQDVQQELDRLTNEYVDQAIQFAQAGDDEQVATSLQAAEALPGRNGQYFAAVRESIDNIRQSRIAEEQSRLERARLAAVQATTTWIAKVRDAIQTGRLISPQGDSAMDYLAEREAPAEQREQLTAELYDALKAECSANINAGNLESAEQLLDAAAGIERADSNDIDSLRASIEEAYVSAESSRIVSLEELVRIRTAPARYPRRAQDREIEGWVEVLFTVTPSGETTDIEVYMAEPADIFDDSAMEAVDKWMFEPRTFRGQVISQRAGARLVFRLE